jgi:transcriptional regulator with XRE-family HTH domain
MDERRTYLLSLAQSVKERRKQCDYSREELALISSLHPNTISVVERAERDVSIVTLIKIVSALGCVGLHLDDNTYNIFYNDKTTTLIPRNDLLSIYNSELIRRIGIAVKNKRELSGMKLDDVSLDTGLHLNTIWNCEQGLVTPDGYTMYRIYNSLGIREISEHGGQISFI